MKLVGSATLHTVRSISKDYTEEETIFTYEELRTLKDMAQRQIRVDKCGFNVSPPDGDKAV